MKYPVIVTEKFEKVIIVEANNEEEALNKCWDEFSKGSLFGDSPVSIHYYTDESETDFEIGSEEDKIMIEEYEKLGYKYDYLI